MNTKKIAALLALALAAGIPAAAAPARAQSPSLNQLGVDRMNLDAQSLWARDGLPLADAAARAELQKLVGVPHPINDKTTATITRIRSVTLDCPVAPGLLRCDPSRIEVAIPRAGAWRVAASADLKVKGKFLGISIDQTFTVNVEVKDLRAVGRFDLDSSDPAAPKLLTIHPLDLDFNLKITTSSWVLNFLAWLTRSTVNDLAHVVAVAGSHYISHSLSLQFAGTPQVVGGSSALAPVAPADLEGAAVNCERQIKRHKMPFGSILEGRFDKPYTRTWEDSLRDASFDLGTFDIASASAGGDSALMTGQYLGGVAFRYGATRSPEALADARELLRSTRTMLTMRGEPGNLNRSIMPYRAGMQLGADWYVQSWQGTDYCMSDYVSRDAYMGTFFGLSLAHDMLTDPRDRNDAREQIEMALDYLLRNGWTWRKRDGSFGERWHGTLEQQWAWVLAAARVNPAKYAGTVAAYQGYADLLWTGIWLGVIDPYYSYYKFNLANGSLYTALRLETDPVRWQRAYQGVAILRRFIGHHQNPHFNNYYLATDRASLARLGAENKNLMTRFLRAHRRKMVVDLTGDATIEKTTYTVPFDVNFLFPGQGVAQTVNVAKNAVTVEKRVWSGFQWSVSPYKLTPGYASNVDPQLEGEGVDLVLPYWMARYYGAIPRPPVTTTTTTATRANAGTTATASSATGVR